RSSIPADTSHAPFAANAEICFEPLATVNAFLSPPLRHLHRIDQRLEDSLRFCGNMNFADQRIPIGCDHHFNFSASSLVFWLSSLVESSFANSASTKAFRFSRLAVQKLRYCSSQESTARSGAGFSW